MVLVHFLPQEAKAKQGNMGSWEWDPFLGLPSPSLISGIRNLPGHKTFQWWLTGLPDWTLIGKAQDEAHEVVEGLGLVNNPNNWGDTQIKSAEVTEQEGHWLIQKLLKGQKRAVWNMLGSGCAQTIYIFHPYILTPVFLLWWCSLLSCIFSCIVSNFLVWGLLSWSENQTKLLMEY